MIGTKSGEMILRNRVSTVYYYVLNEIRKERCLRGYKTLNKMLTKLIVFILEKKNRNFVFLCLLISTIFNERKVFEILLKYIHSPIALIWGVELALHIPLTTHERHHLKNHFFELK